MSGNKAGSVISIIIGIAVLVGVYAMKGVEVYERNQRRSLQEMQYQLNRQKLEQERKDQERINQLLSELSSENTSNSTTVENDSRSHKGHEYVDLGLSVKWATCNVGAAYPEEYGEYFAWGETESKEEYNWKTYQYCKDNPGVSFLLTRYNTQTDYGNVDDTATLLHKDDVARQHWGGNWRIPTTEETKELIEDCDWTWTSQGGVQGYVITGPSKNRIFLPAAGFVIGTDTYQKGSCGYYWSSSLYTDNPDRAYDLLFDSGNGDIGRSSRREGLSIRPVIY